MSHVCQPRCVLGAGSSGSPCRRYGTSGGVTAFNCMIIPRSHLYPQRMPTHVGGGGMTSLLIREGGGMYE